MMQLKSLRLNSKYSIGKVTQHPRVNLVIDKEVGE
jgi:hypothetical protein